MPDSLTTNFEDTKPEVGASEDTWGDKLNNNADRYDDRDYRLLTTANYAANTGTADDLVVALNPVWESLAAGHRVWVKVSADNTGGVTLAVDATGAKAVKLNDGSALTAGVLKAGGIYGFAYDGAAYRLSGSVTGASSADALAGTDANMALTPKSLADLNSTDGTTYIVKLPGGYMIQGGIYTGGSNNPTIAFPVAFSEAPRVTLTAVSTGNNTNNASDSVRLATLQARTAANFTAYCSSESEASDVFVGRNDVSFDWIAFGKVATS